jgi:acetylornithine deacetylase
VKFARDDVFRLTRALVDIESTTENELAVGEFLARVLGELTSATGGNVERMEVTPTRFNIFAHWGEPVVTLSTHMDCVPPFVPSREDDERIWGRGSCDTKGAIAAMICAASELIGGGLSHFGLLFVVGEERNSAGAYVAAKQKRGSKFLINAEPTENKLALGSKGSLRYNMVAKGRMAHSAYPELGESAIDKLLGALRTLREVPLPCDGILGQSTMNIGTISGGRAPNVIADSAQAEVLVRLVDNGDSTRMAYRKAAQQWGVEMNEVLGIPPVLLGSLPGFPTTVVAFTTDIPAFAGAWGTPYLIGPGTIHVAHTPDEHVPKRQVIEAIELYKRMTKELLEGHGKQN